MEILKAISLITGVGGLDFGFEAAGFETAVAVEMDVVCCRTLRLNRLWTVIENNVHDMTSKDPGTATGQTGEKGQAYSAPAAACHDPRSGARN